MPLFTVTTRAKGAIRETWEVEADDRDEAEALVLDDDPDADLIEDEPVGDDVAERTGREVVSVR